LVGQELPENITYGLHVLVPDPAPAAGKVLPAMTPRPLYRWKSFWLGVVVLVFLGWAWVRSVQHRDAVTLYFPSAQHSLTLASRAGSCTVIWEDLPTAGVTWPAFTTISKPMRSGTWFQEAVGIYDWRWAVAYWFLILLFLGPWLGVLFWRVRRRKGTA
jgi:hypothetical protein